MDLIRTDANRIVGRGEMAGRIREYDWASTPLGPIERWSRELVTCVNLTLASSSPARTLWGADFILIYNDAYRIFPGPRHPYALGQPARGVYGEQPWQVVGPLLEQAMATGETVFQEKLQVPLPVADGSDFRDAYVDSSLSPVVEDGRIAGLFGVVRDVTSEVLAQRRVTESEARLGRILESIGDAVIVTDAAECITLMNPAAETLTGWPRAEAHGLPLDRVLVVSQAASAGHTVLQTRDAKQLAVELNRTPVQDDAGDPGGTVLVFRSIEGKLAKDAQAHENERQLQTFVDSIPSLAWVANADGYITWYNRRWYEYTGTTPAEMEGWGWQSVHDAETLPAVMERWTGSIKTGQAFEMVFPLRGADGVLRPFLTRIQPIRDEAGVVTQWFGVNTEIDELQRTRRLLEESERQARRVLRSIGDAVIVTDAETRVRQMNPVAETLTRWTTAEAQGQPLAAIFRIVDETTGKTVESPADKVIRTQAVVGLANHTVLIARDGSRTSIDDSAAPIRDESGALAGIVLVFRDIEERRHAEREREELDQRLQLALSAANGIGIWDWDVANDLVYTDEHFARLYGVPASQARRGMAFMAFMANIHSDDAARVAAEIQAAIATRESFASEYRLRQPDGGVRWVFAKGRCSYALDGRPLRFPGVTVDITERVATEDALRRSEERVRVAMETARLGSWERDLHTQQLECSALCKANYGRAADEPFTHADLSESVHPDDRERMEAAVRQAIESGEPYRCEYRVVWPDGSTHWTLASGRVAYGAKGEPVRMTGVSMDVTERHLAQAALMQTEKLAAVGRLAASIAHEINNPLESVTNLLYLARTNPDPDDIQGYLATAERELRRVSVISNQTLRFYRQPTKAKPVSCDVLFEDVLSIYQGRLVNSRIRVEMRKRARRDVECFDGEIRQVLNNLVGNAIDAMHPLGGTLKIRSRDTHYTRTGKPGIALTVADNGAGIAPGIVKNIFDAFYTTKGIGGTGLGLWVSKEIVDRHEGTLRVRSSQQENHRGTVFVLFLPYEAVAR